MPNLCFLCSLLLNWLMSESRSRIRNEKMTQPTRRDALKAGSSAAAALAAWLALPELAFAAEPGEELVPFLDMPRTAPNRLDWETLDAWLTPQDQVFNVQHYGIPQFDVGSY